MKVKISKSNINGTIKIPPSKSLSHRAIMAAAMSDGTSTISNVLYSKDIEVTVDAMKSLGAEIKKTDDVYTVNGCTPVLKNSEIFCNESGSTIRFMIPVALTAGGEITFTGSNHLVKRPLSSYYPIFEKNDIEYSTPEDAYLPLKVKGKLKPIDVDIEGNISSQFITGLIYAFSVFNKTTKINITTNLESKGYIDLTLDVLDKFGVDIKNNNYESFEITGGTLKPRDYTVEGDFSQVAFYELAGALHGDLTITGLNLDSKQGDRGILDIGDAMGVITKYDGDSITYTKSDTNAVEINLSEMPDLGPAVFGLCALSKGKSIIRGVDRLRIKECERVQAMVDGITRLGGNIVDHGEYVEINGVDSLKGGCEVLGYNDHRIVMALAMLGTICEEPIVITDAHAISKSYPNFFEDFKSINGIVEEV